jgi:hypothetical protein
MVASAHATEEDTMDVLTADPETLTPAQEILADALRRTSLFVGPDVARAMAGILRDTIAQAYDAGSLEGQGRVLDGFRESVAHTERRLADLVCRVIGESAEPFRLDYADAGARA